MFHRSFSSGRGVLVNGLDVLINGTPDLVMIKVPAGDQGVFQLLPCTEGLSLALGVLLIIKAIRPFFT